MLWGPYHATSHHWLLLALGADTQTHRHIHTLRGQDQSIETRRVPAWFKTASIMIE